MCSVKSLFVQFNIIRSGNCSAVLQYNLMHIVYTLYTWSPHIHDTIFNDALPRIGANRFPFELNGPCSDATTNAIKMAHKLTMCVCMDFITVKSFYLLLKYIGDQFKYHEVAMNLCDWSVIKCQFIFYDFLIIFPILLL